MLTIQAASISLFSQNKLKNLILRRESNQYKNQYILWRRKKLYTPLQCLPAAKNLFSNIKDHLLHHLL